MIPTEFAARLFDHAASWVDARSGEFDLTREVDPTELETIEIDGYELVRLIGKGGTGLVYLAKQAGTNREVAVSIESNRMLSVPDGRISNWRQNASLTAPGPDDQR